MHKSVSVQSRRLSEFCDNDRSFHSSGAAAANSSGRFTPPSSKRLLTNTFLSMDHVDADPVPPPLPPMSSHPVLLRQQEANKTHSPSPKPKAVGARPSPLPKPVSLSHESLASRSQRNNHNDAPAPPISHYDVPPPRKPVVGYCEVDIGSTAPANNYHKFPPSQPQVATSNVSSNHRPTDMPPPVLPPKPRLRPGKDQSSAESNLYNVPRMAPVMSKSPNPRDSSTLEDFNIVSESMSLSKLIENHKREFPVQVRVSAGFFGATERETFSDGDLLNIHCMKQLKLVVLKTLKGRKVKVPLNSGLQFGLLFNPKHDASEAVKGYTYQTTGDIIRLPKLPSLVCATKQYKGSNVESSVHENEILLVNDVKPGRFKQNLVCTVIGSGKQKRLSESCSGHFTTDPSRLRMFLSEIVNYFSLPQMAVVYYPENQLRQYNTDEKESIPLVDAEVVRVVGIEVEKTILATSALAEVPEEELVLKGLTSPSSSEPTSPTMFEIPIDLPVMEVQIVEPSESEFEKLYGETRELLETFDPSSATRIGVDDEDIYYTVVRDDENKAGIEFITSEAIYPKREGTTSTNGGSPQVGEERLKVQQPLVTQSTPVPPSQLPVQSGQLPQPQPAVVANSFVTTSVIPPTREGFGTIRSPYQPLTPQHDAGEEINEYIYTNANLEEKGEGSPLYLMVQKMHSLDDTRQKQLQQLETEVTSLKSDLQQMQQLCSDLTRKISALKMDEKTIVDLKEDMQQIKERVQTSSNYVQMIPNRSSSAEQARNIEQLQSMSCENVLELLERMNLGSYKESFSTEQVDGVLLLACDEEILELELGVTSRLHRMRILKLIQGDIPLSTP